jgi:hypothetical protein
VLQNVSYKTRIIIYNIQCFFYPGHRDLHAKKFRVCNKLFGRNFQVKFGRIHIGLVFNKSISVWPIVQNKITELEQK